MEYNNFRHLWLKQSNCLTVTARREYYCWVHKWRNLLLLNKVGSSVWNSCFALDALTVPLLTGKALLNLHVMPLNFIPRLSYFSYSSLLIHWSSVHKASCFQVIRKYWLITSFCSEILSQIVTDSASVERLLGKADVQRPQVVEYCVVCGDKASGKEAQEAVFKIPDWKDY